ncbi:MAG: 16S rRNA (cytosine(967)-C(5))-methyltransferase RsmB [Pseudomonadota bacterium]
MAERPATKPAKSHSSGARKRPARRGQDSRADAARQLQRVLAGRSLSGDQAAADPLRQALVYAVLRHLTILETLLDRFLEKPLRARDEDLRCLLLVGLAELNGFSTPQHAVLDQAVSATARLGKKWARGLVNAVLRSYLRSGQSAAALAASDLEPAVRFSHPRWLVSAIEEAWPAQLEPILRANNEQAPMCLRVNLSRVSRDDYLASLEQDGIEARALPLAPSAIELQKARPVAELPGFDSGLVSVQDPAAQLAAPLLGAGPGMSVLDACAAPGGKTAHLLELQPELALTAVDSDPLRVPRIAENLARLGLSAEVLTGDAGELPAAQFDRILLDAPCSATGVIRRHPDIKWLRRESDIDDLTRQQRRLLARLWERLASGGQLLYATCSLLPAENHLTIESFVAATADARVLSLSGSWGVDTGWGRQLLPGQDGTDGFFYSLLEKR